MKKQSFILSIIGAAVVLAAITALIVVFRDELYFFFDELRDRLYAVKEEIFTPDEYDDYADLGDLDAE